MAQAQQAEPALTERQAVKVSPELTAKVRAWREVESTRAKLKAIVVDGVKVVAEEAKVARKESELRKEIGELIGGTAIATVDERVLFYSRGEKSNPFDKRYEVAWKAAMEQLPVLLARWLSGPKNDEAMAFLASLLPEPTPTITHELRSE